MSLTGRLPPPSWMLARTPSLLTQRRGRSQSPLVTPPGLGGLHGGPAHREGTAAEEPTGPDHSLLEDLLIRCAAGDEEAFTEFRRLTGPALEALTVRRGHSRAAAHAMVLDVHALVWHRAGDFNYGSESSPWRWTLTMLNQVSPGPQATGEPRRWRCRGGAFGPSSGPGVL